VKRLLANAALLLFLSLAGCGAKELGPADPNSVPKIDDPELQRTMNQSMQNVPEEAEKMYGK
jgi:predicted small lipoprotein YifL